MTINSNPSRVTIKVLEQMKSEGEKISMLTAYDYSFAKIIAVSKLKCPGCGLTLKQSIIK